MRSDKKPANAKHDYKNLELEILSGLSLSGFRAKYPGGNTNTYYSAKRKAEASVGALAGVTLIEVGRESIQRLYESVSHDANNPEVIQIHDWLAEAMNLIEGAESLRLDNERKAIDNEIAKIMLNVARAINESIQDIEKEGMSLPKKLESQLSAYRALKPVGKS